jgi:hypothetical protein
MDHSAIIKVAEAMISVFQATAMLEVRKRAAEALDSGDEGAFKAWCAIQKAIRFLQSPRAAE